MQHASNGLQAMNRVTSASVEGDCVTFSSGTKIQLRHVTSISVFSNKGISKFVRVLCVVLFGLVALTSFILVFVTPVAGSLMLAFSAASIYVLIKNPGAFAAVKIVSASGEIWLVSVPNAARALEYRDELQKKIFEGSKGVEMTSSSTVVAPATVTEAHVGSLADELKKLKQLKDDGVLSAEEFNALKSEAIKKGTSAA